LTATPQIRSGQLLLGIKKTREPVFCIWMLGRAGVNP